MLTVGDVLAVVNEIAPFETAEDYDNPGLLCGRPDQPVRRVLTALDLTMDVAREADSLGAQLVVTHHPIFFRGRKNIREDDAEGAAVCALIRSRIALIAAHTNFDMASPGVNDALGEALGLDVTDALPDGLRVGAPRSDMSIGAFVRSVSERLDTRCRVYAPSGCKTVRRVALLGGSGGSYFHQALEAGADVFVTGEIKHHEALEAVAMGLCVIEAGHYETERPGMTLMRHLLAEKLGAIGNDIDVLESQTVPYIGHMT